jgi:hypothetical protein
MSVFTTKPRCVSADVTQLANGRLRSLISDIRRAKDIFEAGQMLQTLYQFDLSSITDKESLRYVAIHSFGKNGIGAVWKLRHDEQELECIARTAISIETQTGAVNMLIEQLRLGRIRDTRTLMTIMDSEHATNVQASLAISALAKRGEQGILEYIATDPDAFSQVRDMAASELAAKFACKNIARLTRPNSSSPPDWDFLLPLERIIAERLTTEKLRS